MTAEMRALVAWASATDKVMHGMHWPTVTYVPHPTITAAVRALELEEWWQAQTALPCASFRRGAADAWETGVDLANGRDVTATMVVERASDGRIRRWLDRVFR